MSDFPLLSQGMEKPDELTEARNALTRLRRLMRGVEPNVPVTYGDIVLSIEAEVERLQRDLREARAAARSALNEVERLLIVVDKAELRAEHSEAEVERLIDEWLSPHDQAEWAAENAALKAGVEFLREERREVAREVDELYDRLHRIEEAAKGVLEVNRHCAVCDGVAPVWDGHDKNPPCCGTARDALRAALEEEA